jgi:hypothetical protein
MVLGGGTPNSPSPFSIASIIISGPHMRSIVGRSPARGETRPRDQAFMRFADPNFFWTAPARRVWIDKARSTLARGRFSQTTRRAQRTIVEQPILRLQDAGVATRDSYAAPGPLDMFSLTFWSGLSTILSCMGLAFIFSGRNIQLLGARASAGNRRRRSGWVDDDPSARTVSGWTFRRHTF